jgi:hypothetical protein
MNVESLALREHRWNYKDFGEVCKSRFAMGTIKDMGVEQEDPLTLADTCDVETDAGSFTGVSFFYHCGQESTIEEAGKLRDSKALQGGALAFRKEMQVKVLLDGDQPVGVISHGDHKPRRCQDIIKLKLVQAPKVTSHELFLSASAQEEYCPMDTPCQDPGGRDFNLTQKATLLMGKKEFWFLTTLGLPLMLNYWGDWLIELGPLMFILSVQSYAGFPAGYLTNSIKMYAALFDEDLKEQAIQKGQQYEKRYIKDVIAIVAEKYPDNPYPGFIKQTQFSQYLKDRFGGSKPPQPRWIYTEIFTEAWDS